jgi:4-hydroxybenzoate polyprenyltransferase
MEPHVQRAVPAPARPPGGIAVALAVLRPRQWTKNALVLAPAFFSQRATDPRVVGLALVATAAFSLVASAVYVLNDVLDAERDRAHPRKRTRPIASGALGVPAAAVLGAMCGVVGLALGAWVGLGFVAFLAAYLAIQVLYCTWMKHVPVLDVFGIASGFVLRVLAGAAAVGVPVSHWLYLCTLLLALFLALAKRRAEVVLLHSGAGAHRAILAEYSLPFLDQLLSIVCGSALLAYALYTLAPETVGRLGNDRLKYSVPIVLLGFFRYLFLLHQRGEGGEPDAVLLKDRPIQLVLLAYAALAAWALYG